MRKYLIITFIIITANSVFGQIPIDSIKAIIQKEVTNKRSKSIIAGIIDANGRQIISAGVISDKNPKPPEENTIYEIGSITKSFTGLLLAEMSLKKELNYNDPISKFLPKTIKTPNRNGKEITLLNLSANRSGLPREPFNLDPKKLDNRFQDYTIKKLYDYISTVELNWDIDSKWQYSNTGFGLLGLILSLVSNKSYESLVKEIIAKPLDMNSTVISLSPGQKLKLATGYRENGKPADPTLFTIAMQGTGALLSNVNDMLTFGAANAGLIKTNLLPAIELSHSNLGKKDGNDGFVAMGWTILNEANQQILWKDGGTLGYRSFLGIDKKKKYAVIILSNTDNSISDIGLHILDSNYKVKTYKYPWCLLDTLRTTMQINGAVATIKLYQELKSSKNPAFIFDEKQLNYLGSELGRAKQIKDAIKIFELNGSEYPKSPIVYESLGELYKRNGNKKLAITYFEKLVEMEPENLHWSYILKKLKSD